MVVLGMVVVWEFERESIFWRSWKEIHFFQFLSKNSISKHFSPLISFSIYIKLDTMNPLLSIKSSCQRVVSDCQFVTINDDAIETAATDMMQQNSFSGNRSVDWDAEGNFVIVMKSWESVNSYYYCIFTVGWHFCADAPHGPLTCQYIFVLDALNFCFWPCEGFEYDYLATCLKKVPMFWIALNILMLVVGSWKWCRGIQRRKTCCRR